MHVEQHDGIISIDVPNNSVSISDKETHFTMTPAEAMELALSLTNAVKRVGIIRPQDKINENS